MKSEFAQRLNRLGTETAFSVSQDAAEFSSQGNTVYPFHLGDLDLPTPINIMDAAIKAMREGKTGCISCRRIAGTPECTGRCCWQ